MTVALISDRAPVVVADRPPKVLHRRDCDRLANPNRAGHGVRPPTLAEARTLPVCQWCARREQAAEGVAS